MALDEIVANLSRQHQLELAILFVEKTQGIWEAYTVSGTLDYTDTVVGMYHVVKPDLLSRSLEIFRNEQKNPGTNAPAVKALLDEFADPIVAMQDDDWEMPDEVEKTFYATYNLLKKLDGEETTVFNESTIYLVMNQAIDALLTSGVMSLEEVNNLVAQYRKRGYRPE